MLRRLTMGYSNDLRVRVIWLLRVARRRGRRTVHAGRGRLGCFTSLATFTRCSKPINAKTATSDVPATSTPGLCVACGRPISGRRVKTSSYGRARQQGPEPAGPNSPLPGAPACNARSFRCVGKLVNVPDGQRLSRSEPHL
jgi:hypothetical protein